MNSPIAGSEFASGDPAGITGKEKRVLVSPLAKRLAKDVGVNLNLHS